MVVPATTQLRGSQAADEVETISDNRARFDIVLLIRHPHLDPTTVTDHLGLSADQSWKAGDPRTTPSGQPLPGLHPNSCWNHVFHYSQNWRFSAALESILRTLETNRSLLRRIDKTGGTTELFLQLPGDANVGDTLAWETLKRFAELRIGLSVETFPDMP
jgi:hypothetical protein